MPWSLGLPIFDKKIGKYMPREPIKEPKKPVPSIKMSDMGGKPLRKGHDTYREKKRQPGMTKHMRTGPLGVSHKDSGSLFFSEISSTVNAGGIVEKRNHGGTRPQDKDRALFVSESSALDRHHTIKAERSMREKGRKKKKYFWEKPKPRKQRSMLSIRGEKVWL